MEAYYANPNPSVASWTTDLTPQGQHYVAYNQAGEVTDSSYSRVLLSWNSDVAFIKGRALEGKGKGVEGKAPKGKGRAPKGKGKGDKAKGKSKVGKDQVHVGEGARPNRWN